MARIGSVAAAPFVGGEFVSLYVGATRVPTVPGKPTISSAEYDGETIVAFAAPSDGGSTITGYKYYFDGVETTPSTTGNLVANFAGDFTGQNAQVAAVNAIGDGPKSAPVTVV
jgi:hypothetical protein